MDYLAPIKTTEYRGMPLPFIGRELLRKTERGIREAIDGLRVRLQIGIGSLSEFVVEAPKFTDLNPTLIERAVTEPFDSPAFPATTSIWRTFWKGHQAGWNAIRMLVVRSAITALTRRPSSKRRGDIDWASVEAPSIERHSFGAEAFQRLTSDEQLLLRWKYLEQMSMSHIANAIGVSRRALYHMFQEIDRKLDVAREEVSAEKSEQLPSSAKRASQTVRSDSRSQRSAGVYEVWYGTNRCPNNPEDHSKGYGAAREQRGVIHRGTCSVVIPETHRWGRVATPLWRRLLDVFQHRRLDMLKIDRMVLARIARLSEQAFVERMRSQLSKLELSERTAVLYLHGYNVGFSDAAIRAAQIGSDLDVPGMMAFFSWPSLAGAIDYMADEATIDASEVAIGQFITQLVHDTGVDQVHIIAHSMGNRGLARVANAANGRLRLGQVILAAPDVDSDLFRDLAVAFGTLTQRTTLYASAGDLALKASMRLHKHSRAGHLPPALVVPGIDTIDASRADFSFIRHGYYATAQSVIYDIAEVLKQGHPPSKRTRLAAVVSATGEAYWKIKP